MSHLKVRVLPAAIILLFCLPDIVLVGAAEKDPFISVAGTEPVLNLSKEQALAIRGYNPNFLIRRQADYLPSLLKQYPSSSRQLPFAVIGDLNGDSRMDVVLQGHDQTSELLIAVLSSNSGPYVMEILRSKLVDPKTEFYVMGDHSEYGLWTYLTFVPRGMVDSPFANQPLKLSTDAFQLNYFEKASVLYYLSGYTFQKYVTGD
jgi:hypothetical protein